MSQHQISDFEAIELDGVTGGVTSPASAPSSSQQVATLLSGLQSSIQGLANKQNNGDGGISQLLPFLMLRGGAGAACPCGCGMANCGRR